MHPLLGLLMFALIGLFVIWLCAKAKTDDYANRDDMTERLNEYNFGDENDL